MLMIYIIITYRAYTTNEINRFSGDKLSNTLDRWCQSRKTHNRETCRTHSGGLESSVHDSHTDKYRVGRFAA